MQLENLRALLQSDNDSAAARLRLLDPFTRAYIEAMLWAETDDKGQPLDANYGLGDIAPETLLAIVADCLRFQQENATDLAAYSACCNREEQGGHDYWLTRNRHGSGYWDRESYLPQGARDRLTRAAHTAGERYVYIGDDKLIHY